MLEARERYFWRGQGSDSFDSTCVALPASIRRYFACVCLKLNCDDDSRCFDGSECSTLAGEECDDWAGGESTETRGRCNGELDDADEDNKEDA